MMQAIRVTAGLSGIVGVSAILLVTQLASAMLSVPFA
jgi:hypothetical protein